MLYTVYYKRPLWFFWKKIKRVKGDYILYHSNQFTNCLPVQVVTCDDETRIELPLTSLIIKFSPERFWSIQKKMSDEAGQEVRVKTNAKRPS